MKWLSLAVTVLVFGLLISTPTASASPQLQLRPLLYEAKLAEAEKKRGVIDITNPTDETIELTSSIAAFEQIDDQGNLRFYEDEALEAGMQLDFDEFRIPAGDTMRLVFELDGTRLPEGDVFAAIFFTTKSPTDGTVRQLVRIGTLFIIENGTAAAREAEITGLQMPLFSFNQKISGQYRIKNIDSGERTGFRPEVTLSLRPLSYNENHQAGLVFSGRERENDFSINTNRIGIYRLTASYGDSSMSRYVVLLPWYVWFVLGGVVLVISAWAARRISKSRHKYKHSKL